MENSPPPYLPENPESLAAALAQHPDYRVLRRLDVTKQRPARITKKLPCVSCARLVHGTGWRSSSAISPLSR
jgi:hypothetical protein